MFKRICILFLFIFVLSTPFVVGQVANAERICDPFTTDPDPGMLPIGTKVLFQQWVAGGVIMKEGVVERYYIHSCFPEHGYIIGLDEQAYVVFYGDPSPYHICQVLNRRQLEVIPDVANTGHV